MKETKESQKGRSQKQQILNCMLAGQSLTCLTAYQKFGTFNLRGRISEIVADRKHKVTKTWKTLRNKKRVISYSISIALMLFMVSCADVETVESCVEGHQYGFWGGLWHGWTAGFAWIGSLFSDDIAIYALNNNGGWYDFGFIIGIGSLSYGTSHASKR